MSAPVSISPQAFLDLFEPKIVISGDGSQTAYFWQRIIPYIAGLGNGGSAAWVDATLAEMATAIAGATLTPGLYYNITDPPAPLTTMLVFALNASTPAAEGFGTAEGAGDDVAVIFGYDWANDYLTMVYEPVRNNIAKDSDTAATGCIQDMDFTVATFVNCTFDTCTLALTTPDLVQDTYVAPGQTLTMADGSSLVNAQVYGDLTIAASCAATYIFVTNGTAVSLTGNSCDYFTTDYINKTSVVVPTNGATVTIAYNEGIKFINPAGTLATLTINFPDGKFEGQELEIYTTEELTAITATGATLNTALTAMSADSQVAYRWSVALDAWY